MNNFERLFWDSNVIKKVFQLEGFKTYVFIHIETKMNSDRKKTVIAIASSYVIRKRRKGLLEKEKKKNRRKHKYWISTNISVFVFRFRFIL